MSGQRWTERCRLRPVTGSSVTSQPSTPVLPPPTLTRAVRTPSARLLEAPMLRQETQGSAEGEQLACSRRRQEIGAALILEHSKMRSSSRRLVPQT